jgi:hypothetical protein
MAKLGPGYALWVSTVSNAIDNIDDIDYVIDTFSAVDDLPLSDFYKKHFYTLYDKDTSLSVSGAPYEMITTVQSNTYQVEVEAINFPLGTVQATPGYSNCISCYPLASGGCRERSCGQGWY